MAPVEVINLDTDSEDESSKESPRKTVLNGFAPRKEKLSAVSTTRNDHAATRNSFEASRTPFPPMGGLPNIQRNHSTALPNGRLHKENEAPSSRPTPQHKNATDEEEIIRQERVEKFERFHKKQHNHSKTQKHLVSTNLTSKIDNAPLNHLASVTTSSRAFNDHAPLSHISPRTTKEQNDQLRDKGYEAHPRHAHVNGMKRPISVVEVGLFNDVSKRSRTHGVPTSSSQTLRVSSEFVMVDSTDPDMERVSYSDEPELPKIVAPPMKTSKSQTVMQNQQSSPARGPSRHGLPFSPEEDSLLKKLRDHDGLSWEATVPHFNGRTQGSLAVRYSTKIKAKVQQSRHNRASEPLVRTGSDDHLAAQPAARSKRERKSALADGFVSWASVEESRIEAKAPQEVGNPEPDSPVPMPDPLGCQDGSFPASLSMTIRQREMGVTTRRAWSSTRPAITRMMNHAFRDYKVQKQYHGTSGDVVALSWSPHGSQFAAGSVAITDDQSMQYNMQRNLLLGDHEELLELVEHYVARPKVAGDTNVNSLHSMRQSQDPRLFMTVTATGFSADGHKLFTAGTDRMLRQYAVHRSLDKVRCRYAVEHPASVDVLSVHPSAKIVATGCHVEENSIRVLACGKKDYQVKALFSASRSITPIYPSVVRWGTAYNHHRLLLAAFCGDTEKDAGETCLWDVETQQKIEIHAATRSVSDVAWNPLPSAASISFVVASNPSSISVKRGTRTVIQCFAPNQAEGRRLLAWESPAADINDVVICPHDENLIAAGATDSKVYIWDYRYVKQSQQPLHTLAHGVTENVIDHERSIEQADTGVKFLCWGATKDRLYSGSSDGVVKVWNPYRSPGNAHIDDIAVPVQQRSAVMAGAFSPDYKELLIGTENGRINLFEAGRTAVYKVPNFKLRPAAPPTSDEELREPFTAARAMLESGQIALRPCGAMPFRQAVQGPNYAGPYMAPTAMQIAQAEGSYHEALHNRTNAVDEDSRAKADVAISKAEARLVDLNQLSNHYKDAGPKAEAFQRKLLLSETPRAFTFRACQLDCRVLRDPEQDEIEDSRRSELRIPEVLKSVASNAAAKIRREDDQEQCPKCCPNRGKIGKLCASCSLRSKGLVTACSRCSGPARVPTDEKSRVVCERCDFACFRCGEPAQLSPAMTCLTCPPCGQNWEIGALGYELATPLTFRPKKAKALPSMDDELWDALGSQEREHYFGLIGTGSYL